MNFIKSFLILTVVLLSSNEVSAQFGNGGFGNRGGNNRGMNSGMQEQRTPEKPKEIPVEVTVGKIIEQIKSPLNLDELQVIAISNILSENIRTQGMLIKAEVPQEAKMENLKALADVTDRKIMDLLNADQKEKFKALSEESKKPKKSKKKKSE
ncbi:hypothetical protein SAMN05444372_11338 [Flavobacterium micromati]|uniref:Protein refolding chaperone Spy/CpxP family n=1 Tax=Flavobacterium micromati TaxID=229205 RepID=A0A1M5PMS1_9FLAO|nr:hypothetical protein [Flavobacterium micromati]MCL6462760.1 hypothetical protein [Flavobacterium micromati]SHH03095.1 hypothetical protein SAMN05444372_11338 [Flavobacterium micromati]